MKFFQKLKKSTFYQFRTDSSYVTKVGSGEPPSYKQVVVGLKVFTTLHGVQQLGQARGSPKRVLWVCVFLACVCGFTYNLASLVLQYRQFLVLTHIQLIHNNTLLFPAVTVCNTNPVRSSQVHRNPHLVALLESWGLVVENGTVTRMKRRAGGEDRQQSGPDRQAIRQDETEENGMVTRKRRWAARQEDQQSGPKRWMNRQDAAEEDVRQKRRTNQEDDAKDMQWQGVQPSPNRQVLKKDETEENDDVTRIKRRVDRQEGQQSSPNRWVNRQEDIAQRDKHQERQSSQNREAASKDNTKETFRAGNIAEIQLLQEEEQTRLPTKQAGSKNYLIKKCLKHDGCDPTDKTVNHLPALSDASENDVLVSEHQGLQADHKPRGETSGKTLTANVALKRKKRGVLGSNGCISSCSDVSDDGYYGSCVSCTGYIWCVVGNEYHFDCNLGTEWDSGIKACTHSSTTCPVIDPCVSHTCDNGGSCSIVDSSAACLCTDGFTGDNCEEVETTTVIVATTAETTTLLETANSEARTVSELGQMLTSSSDNMLSSDVTAQTPEDGSVTNSGGETNKNTADSDVLTDDFTRQEQLMQVLAEMDDEERRRLGYKKSMILSCVYEGQECTENDFASFFDDLYGMCYVYNSGWQNYTRSSTLLANKPGSRYGLTVILDIGLEEYLPIIGETAGVVVVVHKNTKMPFPGEEGVFALPGRSTDIAIRMADIRRLASPFSDCTEDVKQNLSRNVYEELYSVQYSNMACYKTCYQRHVIESCDCADPQYPINGFAFGDSNKACDIKNLAQRECKREIIDQYNIGSLECDCPIPCHRQQYQYTVTSVLWPPDVKNNIGDLLTSKLELFESGGLSNLVKVQVYFENFNYEYIDEQPKFRLSSLFTGIGGLIGLWLGCSILSIIEIMELGLDLVVLSVYKCRYIPYWARSIWKVDTTLVTELSPCSTQASSSSGTDQRASTSLSHRLSSSSSEVVLLSCSPGIRPQSEDVAPSPNAPVLSPNVKEIKFASKDKASSENHLELSLSDTVSSLPGTPTSSSKRASNLLSHCLSSSSSEVELPFHLSSIELKASISSSHCLLLSSSEVGLSSSCTSIGPQCEDMAPSPNDPVWSTNGLGVKTSCKSMPPSADDVEMLTNETRLQSSPKELPPLANNIELSGNRKSIDGLLKDMSTIANDNSLLPSRKCVKPEFNDVAVLKNDVELSTNTTSMKTQFKDVVSVANDVDLSHDANRWDTRCKYMGAFTNDVNISIKSPINIFGVSVNDKELPSSAYNIEAACKDTDSSLCADLKNKIGKKSKRSRKKNPEINHMEKANPRSTCKECRSYWRNN